MTRRRSAASPAGTAPSQRQLRVGEELRHVLAGLLSRGDFRDPVLASLNVTVTEVRISPDLRNATAYVTPLGGEAMADAVAALNHAATYFRAQAARAMRLRHAPSLVFTADTSFDYAFKISQILHQPDVARDLEAAEAPLVAGESEADRAG